MRSPLRLALAGLLAGSIGAGPQAADEGWKWSPADLKEIAALEKKVVSKEGRFQVETANWRIDTPVSARFTAETGRFMELFQAAFAKLVRGKAVVEIKPTVLIFSRKSEYEEKFPDGSKGFFKYRWNGNGAWEEYCLYTYLAGEDRDFAKFNHGILLHEGTHAALRNLVGKKDIATWFNEGLATYVQFWNLQEKSPPNPLNRYRRSFYRAHLKEHCLKDPGKLLSLADLLAVSSENWNPDGMGTEAKHHYALAESLIDFLLSTPKNQATFKRILEAVLTKEGATLLSEEEVRSLQPPWREHVRKMAE